MDNRYKLRLIYFILIISYSCLMGLWHLSSVHYYFDAVGIRDMATSWSSLTWQISFEDGKIESFVPVTILRHIEGPLQFVLLNFYSYLAGNILPLKPATFAYLNIFIAVLSAIVAFLIGKRLENERFGYFFATCYILATWIAAAIRMPWVVFTVSCFLELVVLLCYLILFTNPHRTIFRVLAPLSLGVYLTTALDWPSFLFCFVLFLFLSKKTKFFLKNRYNFFPLSIFIGFIIWTALLFFYALKSADPQAHQGYRFTILTYPFTKVNSAIPDVKVILKYLFLRIGPMFFFALGGLCFILNPIKSIGKKLFSRASIGNAFSLTMVIWFCICSYLLLKSSKSIHYIYVMGIPMAFLAAKFLSKMRPIVVSLSILLLIYVQLHVATVIPFKNWDDDRRILAAAAFLIENRPDMLDEDKVAFLPRNLASNVGQYARGRQNRIVMPVYFPDKLKTGAVGSPPEVLLDFVQTYRQEGRIKADWIVFNSELISPETNKYYKFYKTMYEDTQVNWIAEFVDKKGRKMWLGEVDPDRTSVSASKVYDVDILADEYEKKYDRISFLKRNVEFIDHY